LEPAEGEAEVLAQAAVDGVPDHDLDADEVVEHGAQVAHRVMMLRNHLPWNVVGGGDREERP
jgi:hypothetical protein